MERMFTVKNKLGLHARPAALFVQTTSRFQAAVKVERGGQVVDGKSIMGLMMLAAEEGAQLKIMADGSDEQEMLAALDQLFASRFEEPE